MGKWKKAILAGFCMVSAGVVIYDRIQNYESKHRQGFYEKYVKRVQDFWCAVVALIVLSPMLFVTAILVRKKLGSPVVFRQKRPGKDGRIFELYKYRTMTDERGPDGEILPDEVRLTEFGRKLRSTSLDELLELLNIIKGDMSVVGPRPLLIEYLPRYSTEQKRRHDVRPGLTGLAQVSGRNWISWEEKFKVDCEYVDNIRFLSDWKIIFLTIRSVWKRDGVDSKTGSTMEKFKGTKSKDGKRLENI